MPLIVPAEEGVETLELNGLSLNDNILGLAQLDCPPPRQRQEWIGAADSEHQALARNPLHENRQVTARISVAPQGNMDAALDRVGEIVDQLQAASQTEDGIPLVWQPADGTIPVTFDVLAGEVTELPIDWENGWLAKAPAVTVVMTCKPYWRGEETLTGTASSSSPFVTMELVNLIGDVPALGRLVITDTATQSRRHVEWGLEGPATYNPATSLLIDSDSMVTSGFAGAQATHAGAYDPNASGNQTVHLNVFTTPVAVCGTGDQGHVGTFRVKARVFGAKIAVRLSWQAGDGPVSANAWVPWYELPSVWREIDLGTVTVPAGSGRWRGTIEAYTPNQGFGLDVDYLILVPVTAGYGKARATYSYRPGVLVGYDDFTGSTAAAVLHTATSGRAAPLGGNWVTSGAATDFVYADDPTYGELVKRVTLSDAGPRYALLGSTPRADVEASVVVLVGAYPAVGSSLDGGTIIRWVDSSNYLRATMQVTRPSAGVVNADLVVTQVVAGVSTTLGTARIVTAVGIKNYTIRATAFASGRVIAQALSTAGATVCTVDASSTALATGGALDDGLTGIFDYSPGASATARNYDDFSVSTPATEPVVIYSGRNLQVTATDTIRQDSTGTYTGRPQSYRGSRFLVPVGTSRVLAAARRTDVDVDVADNVTDATQIQVAITSRGLVVPRG